MEMSETHKKKITVRNKQWSDGETNCLMNFYKKGRSEMKNNKRKRLLHDEIALNMKAEGFNRSGKEVKKKIENLLRKYRLEKAKIGTTGGAPSKWKQFSVIQEAVGYLPSLDETLMVETIPSDDENSEIQQLFTSEYMDVQRSAESPSATFSLEAELQEQELDAEPYEASTTMEVGILHVEEKNGLVPGSKRENKNSLMREFLNEYQKAEEQYKKTSNQMIQLLEKTASNDREIIQILKENQDILKASLTH